MQSLFFCWKSLGTHFCIPPQEAYLKKCNLLSCKRKILVKSSLNVFVVIPESTTGALGRPNQTLHLWGKVLVLEASEAAQLGPLCQGGVRLRRLAKEAAAPSTPTKGLPNRWPQLGGREIFIRNEPTFQGFLVRCASWCVCLLFWCYRRWGIIWSIWHEACDLLQWRLRTSTCAFSSSIIRISKAWIISSRWDLNLVCAILKKCSFCFVYCKQIPCFTLGDDDQTYVEDIISYFNSL